MTTADIRVGSEVYVRGAWRRVLHVSTLRDGAVVDGLGRAVVTLDVDGPTRYVVDPSERIR